MLNVIQIQVGCALLQPIWIVLLGGCGTGVLVGVGEGGMGVLVAVGMSVGVNVAVAAGGFEVVVPPPVDPPVEPPVDPPVEPPVEPPLFFAVAVGCAEDDALLDGAAVRAEDVVAVLVATKAAPPNIARSGLEG